MLHNVQKLLPHLTAEQVRGVLPDIMHCMNIKKASWEAVLDGVTVTAMNEQGEITWVS